MTDRTPGPYLRDGALVYALDQRRDDVFREENVFTASVQDANGIALLGECEATAEFIVRACNAHDDMVAAARAIVPWMEKKHISGTLYTNLVDAIELATEEPAA